MRNDFHSSYLAHSAKGKTWSNHKYVARVALPQSGKWLYFYNEASYRKYMNNKSIKKSGVVEEVQADGTLRRVNADSSEVAVKAATTGMKALAKKTSKLKKNIKDGQSKIDELLGKSKKKSGSGSGSSGKAGGKKSKGASGGSGSSKQAKEKAAAATKAKAEKALKEKTPAKATMLSNKQQQKSSSSAESKISFDALKKIYGKKDSEVTTHESKEKLLDNMKTYDDGSFGYLMAGDKAFKWTKEDGQIILKDFYTEEVVSIDEYLKAAKDIKEFRTDKKKK